jgi:CelD/BcsL family acetyltransferase involved in cellulose biosynthesis
MGAMKPRARETRSDHRVEYLDTVESLEKVRGDWGFLVDGKEAYRSNPFLDFGFVRARFVSMARSRTNRPLLAVLYAKERVAAIAPLLIRTRMGIRYAVMLGDGCYDYGDVLFSDPEEAILLLRDIGRKYLFVKFDSLSAGSRILEVAGGLRFSRTTKTCICPIIRLPFSPVKTQKIKDIRYQTRRLEKNGNLSFQSISDRPGLRDGIELLYAMHIRQWESKGTSSIFQDEGNRILYREIISSLGKHTKAVLAVLRYGEDILAMHFGFECGDALYYYKPTINVDYAKHSPGLVLLLKLVEDAQDRGKAMVDLLRGDEGYKLDWTEESVQQFSVVMTSGSLKWNMYRLSFLINETRKKMMGALSKP